MRRINCALLTPCHIYSNLNHSPTFIAAFVLLIRLGDPSKMSFRSIFQVLFVFNLGLWNKYRWSPSQNTDSNATSSTKDPFDGLTSSNPSFFCQKLLEAFFPDFHCNLCKQYISNNQNLFYNNTQETIFLTFIQYTCVLVVRYFICHTIWVFLYAIVSCKELFFFFKNSKILHWNKMIPSHQRFIRPWKCSRVSWEEKKRSEKVQRSTGHYC